jgi:twitching motility protein PilT
MPLGEAYVAMAYELEELLDEVATRDGSDLHLTAGLPPMARLDGALVPMGTDRLTPTDTERLVYSLLTDHQRKVFENRWEVDFAHTLPSTGRFRVNAYFQRGSIGAAFRYLPADLRGFEELGLPVQAMERMADLPRGLLLVTGPTGSGKSTTLAAMIDYINDHREAHIMTVEDPIEYLHRHKRCMVNQREVGADTHSFADGLKYVLRQDPDVIMVGEMRDLDTVEAALTAAETGHLVLSSLHTQDAVQTIDRIIDMYPSTQQHQVRVQLAGTIQGAVSQQLLPRSGQSGRVLASEVLLATPGVTNLIRESKTHQIPTLLQIGHSLGMRTMDQSLTALVRAGKVTEATAMSQAVDPGLLKQMIQEAT